MANKKRVRLTTPKGVAKFPYLNRPDTKFNADGEYRVQLLLDPNDEQVQEFLQRLDELTDEAVEKVKDDLVKEGKKAKAKAVKRRAAYKNEEDQDGEPTGMVEVKFRCKAKVKTKDGRVIELRPAIFDAKAKPVENLDIYGGSVIKVNFTPSPYYVASSGEAGITLQLNAVQVIELVSKAGDAASFGFTEEEGFDSSEMGGAGNVEADDDTDTNDSDDSADDADEEDF